MQAFGALISVVALFAGLLVAIVYAFKSTRAAERTRRALEATREELVSTADRAARLEDRVQDLDTRTYLIAFEHDCVYRLLAKGRCISAGLDSLYGLVQLEDGTVRPFFTELRMNMLAEGDCFGPVRGQLVKLESDVFREVTRRTDAPPPRAAHPPMPQTTLAAIREAAVENPTLFEPQSPAPADLEFEPAGKPVEQPAEVKLKPAQGGAEVDIEPVGVDFEPVELDFEVETGPEQRTSETPSHEQPSEQEGFPLEVFPDDFADEVFADAPPSARPTSEPLPADASSPRAPSSTEQSTIVEHPRAPRPDATIAIPKDDQALLPELEVLEGEDQGQSFPLAFTTSTIGRVDTNTITLADAGSSRVHCEVSFEGSRLVLRDRQSKNGTFCNGERVSERRLRFGDTLKIADTTMRFTCAAYRLADSEPERATLYLETMLERHPDYLDALELLVSLIERDATRKNETERLRARIEELSRES